MTLYRLRRIKTNIVWPPGDMSALLSLDVFFILDVCYFYHCNAGDTQVFCAIITMATWAYQLANIPTITVIFVKSLKSSEDRGPQDLKTGYAEISLVDYVKLVQIKGSAAA